MHNLFLISRCYLVFCFIFTFGTLSATNLGEKFRAPIETERLFIRPISFSEEDKQNLKRLCADNTQAYINACWSHEVGGTYRDFLFENHILFGAAYPAFTRWFIFDKESKNFLGSFGLAPSSLKGFLEFGIQLLPEARGQGIGKEAGAAFLKHCQDFIGCTFPIDFVQEQQYLKSLIKENWEVTKQRAGSPLLINDSEKFKKTFADGELASQALLETLKLHRANKNPSCNSKKYTSEGCQIATMLFKYFVERGESFTFAPKPLGGLIAAVSIDDSQGQRLMDELDFIYVKTRYTPHSDHRVYVYPFEKYDTCQQHDEL